MQDFISKTQLAPLVLLPAAGFGRRVGSPEAKELLPDENQRPLIEWSLEQARTRGWPVHVVLREQKKALIDYLEERRQIQELSIQVISVSRDAMDSLLQSRPFWRARNLVLLPDTRFEPLGALDQIADGLRETPIVYGTFHVRAPAEWGCLRRTDQSFQVFEKCGPPSLDKAWGIIGFQNSVGEIVLQAHLRSYLSQESVDVSIAIDEVPLSRFDDVTRGPASPEDFSK